MSTTFQPDYRHIVDAVRNRRPARLPLYEHIISPQIMETIMGVSFAGHERAPGGDARAFFDPFCRFFKEMTYDTVSYEVCITEALPGSGAIMGGRPGPIQNRRDFEQYPWVEIPDRYWTKAEPRFKALAASLPPGMKVIGGVGNGVFEISEDLVGFEYLGYMQADDPELLAMVYARIGDLMATIWKEFLRRHSEMMAVCRFGDDLGFKTSLLTTPETIRRHIVPQYRRIVDLVHGAGLPFLWHSCGCIFEIMEDAIAVGIDAKHSNEDAIGPFDTWIERYGSRIGLLGGIDVDIICQADPQAVFERVLELGTRFRRNARGYALGSGNSIPKYVPADGYLAMVRAAQAIRKSEQSE
jgi:uroporphyrinogen decarboxylase